MSKMGSHHQFGHLKHKLWPKEGSKINLISLCAGGVQHTIEKLSTRATTLLQTSSPSEVCTANLWGPKIARIPTLANSELPLGSPGAKKPFGCGPRG